MNKIAQIIRQVIGKLMPVDPEVEHVIAALLERLKNHDDWVKEKYMTIKHKAHNIQTDRYNIEKPLDVSIPFRWRSHIKEHVDVVIRNNEVNRLGFIHDVISGKYVYQVQTSVLSDSGYKEWLKENVKSNEYIIINYWIYFLNEESATGFKLAMM